MAWWPHDGHGGFLSFKGRQHLSLFSAWLYLLWGLQAQAAWAPVPIAQLTREADVIAVVRVLDTDTREPLAKATLNIETLLKSPPRLHSGKRITVRFPSPVVPPGQTRMVIAGNARYASGERAVVFLKVIPDSDEFETLQGLPGKLPVAEGRVSAYGMSLDELIGEIRAALK